MKRKIAAILAADIAGYSRLVAEDEEETLRRLVVYRAVFGDFVARYGGRIFNTAGDATLAEFQSAVDAVRCAVDVQESLRTRNLAYATSRHMSYRIGIAIGDIVEREGDLLGDGVNIASRLEALAPAGGICISRSVHEAVTNKVALKFDDLGPLQLKNIPERVHAYTAALDPQGKKRLPSAARRALPAAAVLIIAVAGAGVYLFTPSKLPFVSSIQTGGAGTQTTAAEQDQTPVSRAAPETTVTPAPPAQEEEPVPVGADASRGTDANRGATAPKDEKAAAPTAAPASAPAAEQSPSDTLEESTQTDKSEETCRRYLPSIGKTVEVPCQDGMEAETIPEARVDVPKESVPPDVDAFTGKWGNSENACENNKRRFGKSDRQVLFGSGTAQYLLYGTDGTGGMVCRGARISKSGSGGSFTATCFGKLESAWTAPFTTADLNLNTRGEQLEGVGPDGYALVLSKCN